MVQQALFFVSWTNVANRLYNHLPHQVKKKRGTIRFILKLEHKLASALALRAPLSVTNHMYLSIKAYA